MSKLIVDLEEKPDPGSTLGGYNSPPAKKRWKKVLAIFFSILVGLVLIVGIAGFFYWQYLKSTPQYSLALLVDAARDGDDKTVSEIVDTDEIVDDFVPQVTDKAVELYGRGLPKTLVKEIATIASPVLNVVKERARSELPKQLRAKTKRFDNVPFAAIVIGADRYLDISYKDDTAKITSKLKDRPLEITMKKNGDRWKVVAVKDEQLAEKIAKRIGQQLIALIRQRSTRSVDKIGDRIGIKNLGDLLKRAEDVIRRP